MFHESIQGRIFRMPWMLLALLMLGGPLLLAPSATAGVIRPAIINEFMPAPSAGSEWIEVMGVVSSTYDMTDWSIEVTRMEFGFATRTIALSGTLPDHGIRVFAPSNQLPDNGGILTLKDKFGMPLYSVSYGDQNPGGMPHANLPSASGSAYFDSQAATWYTSSTPRTYGWYNGPPAPSIAYIVGQINADGIDTNLGSMPNPSSASGVWFEKFGDGRITFGSALNFSDYETRTILQDIGSKLAMSAGSVAFDASTADQLKDMGAEIIMYGLDDMGFAFRPQIQVMTDYGTIIPQASSTYPTLNTTSFTGGALTFTTDHFTGFTAYKVLNTRTGKGFNTIQSAVSDIETLDGDTLNVSGGTYAEDVYVDKQLTFSCNGGSIDKFIFDASPIVAGSCNTYDIEVGDMGSVQEAVDAISGTGTITVTAGSHAEDVNVYKTMTITGTGSPTVNKFVLTAKPITISGFNVYVVDVASTGSIADGVAANLDGGTLNIGPGTYSETVTLDKFLHILGTGSPTLTKFILNTAITDCSDVSATTVDVTSVAMVGDGIECVSSGGTVNLAAHMYGGNFLIDKPMTVRGVSMASTTITDLADGLGLFTVTADNVTIRDLTVRNAPGKPGIDVQSADYFQAINVFSTQNTSGLGLTDSHFATLTNVTLTDNWMYGLMVLNSNTTTVTGSTITWNGTGVYVDGTSSNIQIHTSNISDNTQPTTGAANYAAAILDASRNWWGSTTGPWHDLTNPAGTGNPVSNNVRYRAYYTDAGMTTLSTQSIDPTGIMDLVAIGSFEPTPGEGQSTTPSILVTEDTTITLPGGGGTVLLPRGTIITRTGGGEFDASTITGASLAAGGVSGLATGTVVDGVLQWGASVGLTFSQPITIRIYVGAGMNGRNLTVLRSPSSMTSGWTSDGLVTTSCTVAEGYCTFQTTKASYYTTYHSSSNGGGGGGGGGGEPTLPPVTTVFQTTGSDPNRQTNLANLTKLNIQIHALVKLADDGKKETQEDTAVYYIGADGKRHAFPTSSVFFTWYKDFAGVQVVSADVLASIPLGKNVRYRPGVKMVKLQTRPETYAVAPGGMLRWIKTQALAQELYGAAWNTKIDDLSEGFFINYNLGTEIATAADFNPATVTASVPNISVDLGL